MAATATTGMPVGVRAWVCGLATVAAVGVVAMVDGGDVLRVLSPLGLALVVGIAVAEVWSVWESGRPRTVSMTVSEVFVGIALVALPGSTVVLVCLLGSCSMFALRYVGPKRGAPIRSPLVFAHGIALPVVRCLAAVLVVGAVGPGTAAPLAALLGIATLVAVDTLATTVVVRLETGLPLQDAVGERMAVETSVAASAGALGVLLGTGIAEHELGWLPVLGLAVLVLAASHAGTTWSRERRRSALVLDVVRATGSAAADGAVAEVLVARIGAALHARRVELTSAPPSWAAISAPLGEHGWIGVAERTLPTQAVFDRGDQDLLTAVASVATIALDNAVLLERLADEERLRSTLLAAAAHDLRSPLAVAGGALQAAGSAPDGGAAVPVELLRLATSGVERASRLVHDLIVLERQYVDGQAGRADAGAVAAAVVDVLPPERAARCTVVVHPDVPEVAMSAVLLERVVDNLVGNALKHTPAEGPVDVLVRRVGDEVELVVDDRGRGVPPAQRQRVLAPFATAAASTAGYGLGLHIAVEFVRRAGGSLSIHDRDDGPGASFRVRLPVAGHARTTATTATTATARHTG